MHRAYGECGPGRGEKDLSDEGILREIREAFIGLAGVERIRELANGGLKTIPPLEMVRKMNEGLEVIGRKYEDGELWLSDLIMAGIISKEFTDILRPYLTAANVRPRGRVVIGTVRGDIHDIGKNLVAMMLTSMGFQVEDLGVDVPSEKFVSAVREARPDILAMSCLLTVGMGQLREVINRLEQEGLRTKIKVLVGGRPLTPDFAKSILADGYAKDAVEATRVAIDALGAGSK